MAARASGCDPSHVAVADVQGRAFNGAAVARHRRERRTREIGHEREDGPDYAYRSMCANHETTLENRARHEDLEN